MVLFLADLLCGLQLHLVDHLDPVEVLLVIGGHFLLVHLVLLELALELFNVLLALHQSKALCPLHFFQFFVVLVLQSAEAGLVSLHLHVQLLP